MLFVDSRAPTCISFECLAHACLRVCVCRVRDIQVSIDLPDLALSASWDTADLEALVSAHGSTDPPADFHFPEIRKLVGVGDGEADTKTLAPVAFLHLYGTPHTCLRTVEWWWLCTLRTTSARWWYVCVCVCVCFVSIVQANQCLLCMHITSLVPTKPHVGPKMLLFTQQQHQHQQHQQT